MKTVTLPCAWNKEETKQVLPYVEHTEGTTELDGEYVTREELDARLEYCRYHAHPWQATNGGSAIDNRWSDIFGAIDLWLTSQYDEQWGEFGMDDQGRMFIEENEWQAYITSQCEDYAYQDTYENGRQAPYAWMVGALHFDLHDFDSAIVEYAREQGLPFPEWVDKEMYDEEDVW